MNDYPSIANARLPVNYEAAKAYLTTCVSIDECKNWADKAAAMASYAKQSKDDSLRKLALRIQARAIRRCGELLKQIEPSKGGQPTHTGNGTGRSKAAAQAGLSKRQKDTALQVATVPEDTFEKAIGAETPSTVTMLAEQGTKHVLIDLQGIAPTDYARATEAQGTLRRFAEYCEHNAPQRIAHAFKLHEIPQLRSYVLIVDAWLDRFITNLPE